MTKRKNAYDNKFEEWKVERLIGRHQGGWSACEVLHGVWLTTATYHNGPQRRQVGHNVPLGTEKETETEWADRNRNGDRLKRNWLSQNENVIFSVVHIDISHAVRLSSV